MSNTHVQKYSTTPSKAPVASDIVLGQLAINAADGKLYLKKTDGQVVQIGDLTSVNADLAVLRQRVQDLEDRKKWSQF